MANNNTIKYTLDFTSNLHDTQTQLNALAKSLKNITTMNFNNVDNKLSKNLNEASLAAVKLEKHLKTALNQDTGKIDMVKLNRSLKSSGDSAVKLSQSLMKAGKTGSEAFMNLARTISQAQAPTVRLSETVDKLWGTLKNTIRWQISSSVLNSLTSAFSSAWHYAKELDQTMTKIQVVSGISKEGLDNFTKGAKTAAKELKTSVNEVAKASSIFFQQGDSWETSLRKAETTLKAVNVSFGANAEQMSEYLTAIWNSYNVGAASQELFVDKLAALGAATASSLEEISTAMQKVAATANAVGVNFDQLSSIIATVNSVTRESPETTGTAFKTIFARINDLKVGGSLTEDGFTTTLGDISEGLYEAGLNVLDVNGNLKDTGVIIEQMGNSWQNMTTNQKVAIAQLVAGKRQYTQLMALFENWDKYQENMVTSSKARGTLDRQNEKAIQSINKELEELKGVATDFWNKIFDKDTVVGLVDMLTDVIKGLDSFVDGFGGFGPLLTQIGAIFMRVFSTQIAGSLRSAKDNFMILIGQGDRLQQKANKEWLNAFQQVKKSADFSDVQLKELSNMEKLIQVTQKFGERFKGVNSEAKQYIQMQLDMIKNQQELSNKKHAEAMSEIDSRKRSTSNDLRSTLREVGQSKKMSIRESAIAANDATLKNIDFNGMTGNLDDIIMQIANTSDNAGKDISDLGQHLISLMGDAEDTSGALDKITESLKSLLEEAHNTISANVEYEIEQDEITENMRKTEKNIEAGQIIENTDFIPNVNNASTAPTTNDASKEFDVGQGFVDVQQMQSTGKKRSKDPVNRIIKNAASDLGMDSSDQLSAVPVADLTAKLEEQMATLEEGTQKWNQYKEAIDKVKSGTNFDEKSFDKFESAGGEKTSKKDRKALQNKDKENKKSEKKEISSLKKKFKTIEKEEKKSDKKRNKNKNKNRENEEKADKKSLDKKENQNKNYIKKVEEQEKESAKEKGKILDETSDNIEKSEEKNLNTYEKKVKATSANVGSDIMKVAGAITSIASMWSSVNNAIEVCTDSSASFGEQTMAVVGAVTNGFMTFGQIVEGVKSTQLLINSATVMWGRIRSGEHKKEMAENAAKQVSNTTTALTQAAANWWAAGLILALLAAAGIATAINASSSSNVKAAESANESFSQASAHLEEEKGKLDEINGSLEEKKKELEELKQLQLEGNHQHDAEIARLKNEIGLLEQKKAVQEQRVKTAEKSEKSAAEAFARNNTAWDTVYTFTGESNGKTLDDYQKVIDEYYQSEEYENALHALEVLDPNSAEYKKIEGELEYISNMSEALVQMREEGIYNVGNNKARGREILKQIQDRNTKLEQEALNESVRSDPTQSMERVKQLMKSSGNTFTSEFLNMETGINNLEAALARGDITQTEFFTSLAEHVKEMDMGQAFGKNYEAAEEFFNMVLTYGEGAMNSLTEQFNNGSISTMNYMENIMKLNESYVEMGRMAIDKGYVSEDAMGKWVEQLKEANVQLEKIKNILPEIGEDSSIKDMASYLSEIGYSAESLGQFAKEKLNIDLDVKTNETIEDVLSRSTNAYKLASDAIVEEYQKQMAEVYEAQYMINSTMEKQLNNISMTATKDENGNYIIKTGDDISSSSGDVKQYIEDKNIDVFNGNSRQYFGTVKNQMDNMAAYGMQIGMAQSSGKDITGGDAYNRMAIAGVQQAVSAGWIDSSALSALGISKTDVESGNINWQTVKTLKDAGYMGFIQPFIDAADKFRQYAVDMKITEGQIDAYSTGRAQAPGIGESAYGLGPEALEKAQDAVDKWKDLQKQLEDSYEELADAWDEEYLARLEDDLEKHQQILDEYQKQIDNVDWFNDLLPEDSFLKLQNQTEQYGRNINQLTSQLDEFNRVYDLVPRNAEEAQAIFDQLSSLGDGIQNSVEQIHDLKYELMSLESNMFINLLDENGEILDAEFDRLDKLHESIMDTSEYGESTKQLLLRGGSSALQLSRDRKDRVQKREEEDKKIYDLVKDLNDKIFKKEKELLEMTSKEAAAERAEQREDIETEIADLQTQISDAAKAVAEIVGKNNDELIEKLVGDHQRAALLIKQAYSGAIPGSEDGSSVFPDNEGEEVNNNITPDFSNPPKGETIKVPRYKLDEDGEVQFEASGVKAASLGDGLNEFELDINGKNFPYLFIREHPTEDEKAMQGKLNALRAQSGHQLFMVGDDIWFFASDRYTNYQWRRVLPATEHKQTDYSGYAILRDWLKSSTNSLDIELGVGQKEEVLAIEDQYAKGTTGTSKDQLANVDEMGEELILHAKPQSGRLEYLTKGTAVIPHDMTENLMEWGKIKPGDQPKDVAVINNNTSEIDVNVETNLEEGMKDITKDFKEATNNLKEDNDQTTNLEVNNQVSVETSEELENNLAQPFENNKDNVDEYSDYAKTTAIDDVVVYADEQRDTVSTALSNSFNDAQEPISEFKDSGVDAVDTIKTELTDSNDGLVHDLELVEQQAIKTAIAIANLSLGQQTINDETIGTLAFHPLGNADATISRSTGHTYNGKPYEAIDFSVQAGTPVRAYLDGVVKTIGDKGDSSYGKYIIIEHTDGYSTLYAHLSNNELVKEGDEVKGGSIIGLSGDTGTSTGDHLHFELRKNGTQIRANSLLANYKGSKNTPKGKSLVGEIGTELIIYPDGSSYLAGINGPEVLDLPQGTQVFNAQDTQDILNSKGTPNGNIQGFADGSYNGWTWIFKDDAIKENTEAIKDNTEVTKEERDAIIKSELEIVNSMLKNAKELENDFGNSLIFARGQYEDATKLVSNRLLSGEISEAQYYVQQGRNEKIYGQKMQYEAEQMMDAWEDAKERYLSLGVYNQETEDALNEAYKKIIELSEKGAEASRKADEQLSEYVQKQIDGLEAISSEIEYQYQLKIDAMDKEIQARQNLIDLQKSYNSHMKELREIENDIEKTLRQSKANIQWLDRETRDLLFNQTDYYEILQKTNSIQSEITQLHVNYQEKISNLNEYELDQASLLTEEYEAQVAAKKEELETLKISLQLDEKQNALNSALMERNVRVFAGGRWRQVANIQNVQKTYEDYQNVVDQLKEQEITNAENKAIREEEALNRELELKKAAYEAEIAMMQEENEKLKHELDVMTSEFDISNVSLKKWNEKLLDVNRVMDEAYEGLKNFGKKINGSYVSNATTIQGNIVEVSSSALGANKTFDSKGNLSMYIMSDGTVINKDSNDLHQAMLNAKSYEELSAAATFREQKIKEQNIKDVESTQKIFDEIAKDKGFTKNAKGTRNAKGGISQVNELGIELLATNSGQFIELNPHEKIFNNEQMNFLYDFSRRGIESTEKAVSSVSAYNDESMLIENLTLELPNVTDTNSFVEGLKGLKEHMRNVKTIR